jgi:hypothetical protein
MKNKCVLADLTLAKLVAIFAGLEYAGLLYMARSVGESPRGATHQSSCPASVHHSGMGLASSRIHL